MLKFSNARENALKHGSTSQLSAQSFVVCSDPAAKQSDLSEPPAPNQRPIVPAVIDMENVMTAEVHRTIAAAAASAIPVKSQPSVVNIRNSNDKVIMGTANLKRQQQQQLHQLKIGVNGSADIMEMVENLRPEFCAADKSQNSQSTSFDKMDDSSSTMGCCNGYATIDKSERMLPHDNDLISVKINNGTRDDAQPERGEVVQHNSTFQKIVPTCRDTAAITTTNNNNIFNGKDDDSPLYSTVDKSRLKKYKEDIKKKKDVEMKQAAEIEFLRSSLRGSKKLKSLEQTESGRSSSCHNNDAFYEGDEPIEDNCTAELNKILVSIHNLTQQPSTSSDDSGIIHKGEEDAVGPPIVHRVPANKADIVNKVYSGLDEVLDELNKLPNCSQAGDLVDILRSNAVTSLFRCHDQIADQLCCDAEQATCSSSTSSRTVAENDESGPTKFDQLTSGQSYYTPGGLLGFKETILDGNFETCDLRVVRIIKDGDLPLGATVKNEGESILISRIVKGGVADKSGLLKEGDELLEVNGTELRGKSVHEVCDILANMSGELTFVVLPVATPFENFVDSVPQHVVRHVRALFNYEPDDDPYLPCRELGLHFCKGDILHVISASDANWWQALRDGEENVQQLAGLVPSADLQIQKEQYNREVGVAGDSYGDESALHRRTSFLICTRGLKVRTLTKQKKRSLGNNNNEDTLLEIPTYEDVALYLPPTGRRRPLVLVGPQNVGCLELRQKLIEQEKDLFAGVVPHTTRPKRPDEQEGVHYHFLTRAEFQSDVKCLKFVEWGEYQKHYYGTSFDAIRRVIQRGKTCVLTMKVQSIKNIRNADLMPYVIFVSPPSFERLKLNRRKMGDKDVKEDELKAIIYEAKETEDKFGHLFDKVLVNYDLDRAYREMRTVIHRLETEPQWIPSYWLKDPNDSLSR